MTPQDVVVGMGLVEELVAEGDREETKGAVEGAVGGAEADGVSMGVLTKSGGEVAVTSDVGPRRAGGEITGSMVLARRDAGKDMLDMLDKLGIAAWFTNMEGAVDDCNKTACALVEREKDEVMGVVKGGALTEGEAVEVGFAFSRT